MKKTIIILTTITFFTLGVNAQTKRTEHQICDTKQTRKLMATAILHQVILYRVTHHQVIQLHPILNRNMKGTMKMVVS